MTTSAPLNLGWTLGEMASLVHGSIVRGADDVFVERLVQDTRVDCRGAMFIAIKGENFDGHRFVTAAAKAGAAGAAVCDDVDASTLPDGFFILRVGNTVHALGHLARARRRKLALPVVAVAGSSGKTTTKDMIAHLLAGRMKVHKTPRNENNLIGAPQSVLALTDEHEAAVVELGMNEPGELRALTRTVEPDICVLVNIGLAHVGMFGAEAALIRAKADFVDSAPTDAVVIHNADCERSACVVNEFLGDRQGLSVGESADADAWICDVTIDGDGYRFSLEMPDGTLHLRLPGFGRFNVANAAMAATVATRFGMTEAEIAGRLASFASEGMRSETIDIAGLTVIADCYNANPDSMSAAVLSLAEFATNGRRVAVLGDMLELGDKAAALHEKVGQLFGDGSIDLLVTVGELGRRIHAAAVEAGQSAVHADSAEEATTRVLDAVEAGDVVLVKGSRGMTLERVVEGIRRARGFEDEGIRG